MEFKHGVFNQKLAELSLITCNYVSVQSSLVGAWSAKATSCWYQSRYLYKFLRFFLSRLPQMLIEYPGSRNLFCIMRLWFRHIGFGLGFTSLLLKTWR